MFTGIIEELGTVAAFDSHATGARLRVTCSKVVSDATEGSSISVNGVCLTALNITPSSFESDLAPETLKRSNLGLLQPGSRVNLERPVTASTRLSGHIVQGHVDGTGELISMESLGDGNWWLNVRVPGALDRYLVEKGSISIDGVSLTIASLGTEETGGGARVGIAIIPHTYSQTTLGLAHSGTLLNIEVDVLAKHVEKLLRVK